MAPPAIHARQDATTTTVKGLSQPTPWRTAWITGASTGIGREVALLLARRGVRVAVSARSTDGLAQLSTMDQRLVPFPLDVTDAAAVRTTVARIHKAFGALDLVILNAGVWDPMGARDFGTERATHSMAVNYTGITNAIEPPLPLLVTQGRGQLALVASVAGYRGLPSAAAYAPTKAAVIALAEALKAELKMAGISVSVVNPGFVETPMTIVNHFPMPFLMSAPDAAARILRGLERKKFEIAFPWPLVNSMKAMRILPYGVFFWLIDKFVLRKTTAPKSSVDT